MARLDEEVATYEREKPRLLQWEGLYVLISAHQVAGVFTTREAAMEEGYRSYWPGPFLVQQINETEPVIYLRRFSIEPCLKFEDASTICTDR